MLCIVYEVCQICERRLSCSLVIAGISGHSVPIDHNADAEGNFSVLALKRDPDARHTHGWRFTTVGIVEKKKPDDVSFQLPISICHAYVNWTVYHNSFVYHNSIFFNTTFSFNFNQYVFDDVVLCGNQHVTCKTCFPHIGHCSTCHGGLNLLAWTETNPMNGYLTSVVIMNTNVEREWLGVSSTIISIATNFTITSVRVRGHYCSVLLTSLYFHWHQDSRNRIVWSRQQRN